MDRILYLLARGLIGVLQSLSLTSVARLGRFIGGLIYWVDARHRRVAIRNLEMCFTGEKSTHEIRLLAKENFKRIGENFACAAKTASMSLEELRPHLRFSNPPALSSLNSGGGRRSIVAAIGHFGNFELYARFTEFAPGFRLATTYRGLRQASLNRLLLDLRQRSGCVFFERRWDAKALRAFMNQPPVILGLLADQHAGDGGLRLPFLGHECSTSAAPAVFALRYDCILLTGFCFRESLAKWRIEAGPAIPTHEHGAPRTVEAIMLDVNRAFETAVKRDPANWFWVHNRWKKPKVRRNQPKARTDFANSR